MLKSCSNYLIKIYNIFVFHLNNNKDFENYCCLLNHYAIVQNSSQSLLTLILSKSDTNSSILRSVNIYY